MSKYKSHKGWYKVLNQGKLIKPLDEYMQSTKQKGNEFFIQFKSALERIAFCYADLNPKVVKFAIEPFNIPYIKPTDGQQHRYFIDMFIEFNTGDKFIVEIKSYNETVMPQPPKIPNPKAILNYKQALETFVVNQAKWKAAREFAAAKGLKFIILTERELRGF